jgi:hypothetical protein
MDAGIKKLEESGRCATMTSEHTADEIIADLEARGLGWSIKHMDRLIECRIWKWPYLIGRYLPSEVVPLADMLLAAYSTVNLHAYPIKK